MEATAAELLRHDKRSVTFPAVLIHAYLPMYMYMFIVTKHSMFADLAIYRPLLYMSVHRRVHMSSTTSKCVCTDVHVCNIPWKSRA